MLHAEESKQKKGMDGFSDFKAKLGAYRGQKGSLIPLLQMTQETYGYIPEPAIGQISEASGVPTAEIYGVITFYSQFRLRPTGKNIIKICDGTACHVNASSLMIRTIEEALKITNNETTEDGVFTLQKVACLGCCSLSPVVMINGETHGRLTPKKVQQLLKDYRDRSQTAEQA